MRKKLATQPNLSSSVITAQGKYNDFTKGSDLSSKNKKCMRRWSRSLIELNNDEQEYTDIPLNIDHCSDSPKLGSLKNSARKTMIS